MSDIDVQFPPRISFHAIGGPGFLTNIVVTNSGKEYPDQVWQLERGSWEVSHAARLPRDYIPLQSFFRIAAGRANTFRLKDWTDYQVTAAQGILKANGVTNQYQMYKRYVFASPASHIKGARANLTAYILGDVITLTANDTQTHSYICTTAGTTAAAQSTLYPGVAGEVITDGSAHFTERSLFYDRLIAKPVNGPTAVQGGTTPTIAYTTGIVTSTTAPTSWSGEFDCKVRFDTDQMRSETIDKSGSELIIGWASIPIVEVK